MKIFLDTAHPDAIRRAAGAGLPDGVTTNPTLVDQQCDADLPPGTVSFIRLVSVMYQLDEAGYDCWYGFDLFPYRGEPRAFIELSRDNLRLAQAVLVEMNARGARQVRESGWHGPETAVPIRDCVRAVR